MASGISLNLGAAAEVHISPGVASPTGLSFQRSASRTAPGVSPPPDAKVPEVSSPATQKGDTPLATLLERAQNVALANTTTLSFERDEADGRIYIHIKDKRTGEELCRIPQRYLTYPESESGQHQRLDLRI